MGFFDRRQERVLRGSVHSSRSQKALTASAQRVSSQKAGGLRRLAQPWQQRALAYYDLVGESWFASQFYARALKQIRFFPARMVEGEPEEITEGTVLDLWSRIKGEGGGTVEIQEQYGRLMFLTGEGYLLVTGNPDDEGEIWEFVSNAELRMDTEGRLRRYKAPASAPQELRDVPDDDYGELEDGEAVAYRLWRRHPTFSALADSPMHAVLDLFEELLLLQMAVRSRVKSRLAGSGLLVLDDSITFKPIDGAADDRDPMNDPFVKELVAHMTAPIGDEGTAAAVVPHVIRLPNPQGRDLGTLIKHIKLHDPNETYRETGLRKECIERIAIGLDMPPEILLGLGDANHWSGWLIDEQVAKGHIFPVADQFCLDVASAYLRPAARDAGEADWQDVVIGYDAAELVVHPDRGENAREAFDRRAIGYTAFRDAHGFTDEDAPSEDDLALMDTIDGGSNDAAPVDASSTDETPPEEGDDEDGGEDAATASVLVASPRYERIMGAAEFAVHRARELAGARLRSRAQRNGTAAAAREALRDVPNDRVAFVLGSESVLAHDPATLVAGASQSFSDAATRYGLGGPQLAKLGAQIESHAAETLLLEEPTPLPAGFTAYLARVERETR